MINHARCLLLNRDAASGTSPLLPGEEFVDPSFKQRMLPQPLQLALQLLLGRSPDRPFLNYRLRQLLTLLHSTELGEHLLALDPRVTYLPFNQATYDGYFGIKANQFAGDPGTLYVAGDHVADEGVGRSHEAWLLTIVDDATVRVARQVPPLTTATLAYTMTDGLSSPVALSGTLLKARYAAAHGAAWVISSDVRPSSELGPLLQNLVASMGTATIESLLAGDTAPMPALRQLWEHNELFGYKYGALLLGIIYALNKVPQAA